MERKIVHVVGTGTIGEPLIGLLCDYKEQLGIDEVTFNKNTPLRSDRSKVIDLLKRGARLAVNSDRLDGFKELGMDPDLETEEAIRIANDTDYGLGGGVFTKDLNKAAWTANQLQSGQVYVNKWFTGSHATPFGGYKQSGYSREKGVEALKAYLQVKNVGISLS